MKFSLTIEVPDDADPGAIYGAMLNGAVQFGETTSFMPMDVDGQVSGKHVVVKMSGHRTPFDWTVQRIE